MTNETPGIRCVTWSPDGGRVAGGTWEAEVIVWDPRTGEMLQELIHSDQPAVQQAGSMEVVEFSPDGGHVWALTQDDQLLLFDATTGTRTTLRSSRP